MSKKKTKLNAKWQLDAAMLSRPVDLTALLSLSQTAPEQFFEDNVAHLLVSKLLNNADERRSDKDTKLDVLTILGNLATMKERRYKDEIRMVLQGVNKWFDDYLFSEEVRPNAAGALGNGEDGGDVGARVSLTKHEPELHKAMLVLLARCFDYKLKTEDLLELTGDNRILALEVIVSLLEEGETYTTELTQRQAPGGGSGPAQWEHQLVCMRHERPLILQMCRLLRGFTHPSTYFTGSRRVSEGKDEEYDVEEFSKEMASLLQITVRSQLVEKLSVALHDVLFQDDVLDDGDEDYGAERSDPYGSLLCESDHLAVAAIHEYLQNLYTYAAESTSIFRQHILTETLLIPRLILPYLDRCAAHAELLCLKSARETQNIGADNAEAVAEVSALALEYPALAQGIATSLRTLVIASFRAPPTRFVLGLLRRLNPTASLLRAGAFVAHHDYLLTLVCLVNVNMGALDLSTRDSEDAKAGDKGGDDATPGAGNDDFFGDGSDGIAEAYYAKMLLNQLRSVVGRMSDERKHRVLDRLRNSSAMPVMRDTPSFAAVQIILEDAELGGDAALAKELAGEEDDRANTPNFGETMAFRRSRSEAKAASLDRVREQEAKVRDEEMERERERELAMQQRLEQEAKATAESKEKLDFRLLGDLPPIEQTRARERVNVDLVVPELDKKTKLRIRKPKKEKRRRERGSSSKADEGAKDVGGAAANSPEPPSRDGSAGGDALGDMPREYACAINGHMMKDPVRTPAGKVFERETIMLWLQTRGSICPITGDPLTPDDLSADIDLRQNIMRWQISNLLHHNKESEAEDPYDF
uniref:U-box domain-containing protein n=1 Tax=Phaeomonas parva TaxID=124430 RepID=A0A7S1TRP6_9STRA|mmetsp:Transcript_1471/g.3917  ORF Transcript_1471/g.3917 Transcript_1471/m.3917 type:complete len:814 (+) Transcript_1471:208-2649(+)